MLIIRREQMGIFQKAISPKLREAVAEDLKKKGIEAEDDPKNRAVALRDKSGGTALIRSDKDASLSLISGEKRTHRFDYDSENRLSAITDPSGFRTDFLHDSQQPLIGIYRGTDNAYGFRYDESSNLIEIKYPDKTAQRFDYDKNGNFVRFIDRNGNKRSYVYSATGQLTSCIDANGNETRFRYSQLDAPCEIEFANGNRYDFDYDQNGALSRFYVNGEPQAAFKFDPSTGSLAISGADGEQSKLLIKENKLVEAVSGNSRIEFAYDTEGRILSENAYGGTVEYARNEIGALVGMAAPDMGSALYDLDGENRIKRIVAWRNKHFDVEYNPSGTLSGISFFSRD